MVSCVGQSARTLKEELEAIVPILEEMRKQKIERRHQFLEVLDQIKNISKEIYRSTEDSQCTVVTNECDLSLKRLEELHIQLHALQKEKVCYMKSILILTNCGHSHGSNNLIFEELSYHRIFFNWVLSMLPAE